MCCEHTFMALDNAGVWLSFDCAVSIISVKNRQVDLLSLEILVAHPRVRNRDEALTKKAFGV